MKPGQGNIHMNIVQTGRLALVVGLAAITTTALAQKSSVTEKKLYCWNEGGRRVCGDALPASAVDKARTEVSSRSGLPGNRIDRALTADERAALAAQQASAAEQAEVAAADQRRNMALAESYDSEEALRHAFKIRYEMVDEGIETSKLAVANQRRVLLQLLNAAADAELRGGKVPPKLAQNVLTQHGSVVDAINTHRIQQEERAALDVQLAEALARYRKAKGIAAPAEATPAATAPASPAAPAATSAG